MAAVKWFLNARESLERNSSSTNFLIFPLSVSPSTEVITCFNRVVISESTSLLNFFKLLISASIALSSLLFNSLYLIWRLDAGNVNSLPVNDPTTITDLTGNGNYGTLTNGPTYSQL